MKIGLYTLCLLCFAEIILGQNSVQASHQLEENHLNIEGISPSILGGYLDSTERNSGLSLRGWTYDLDILVDSLSQGKHSKSLFHELEFDLSGYKTSLFLEFNQHATEDSIIFKYQSSEQSTLGFNPQGFIYTRSLADLQSLRLVDHPPYQNSSLVIRFITLQPRNRKAAAGFGDAGACQVNANCLPDTIFTPAQKATVRILWRNGNLQGWCSGSLINTVNYSFAPYILSAEHCALANGLASSRDFGYWLFYFNYQSPGCENPTSENSLGNDVLAGAELLSRSNDEGGQSGSDFLLLRLDESIPASFDVRYAGWDRSNLPPQSGRSYHHPGGDIKKMSVFSRPAQNSSFGDISLNTHWQVRWNQTNYGYGTTEGGSSGSALLNEQGLIKGVLTGGNSSCSNLDGTDLYGKFSYSWDQNGNGKERRLAPWLDPQGSGVLSVPSAAPGEMPTMATRASISLYPLPIEDDWLRLRGYDVKQTFRLRIFDLQGKKISDQKLSPLNDKEQTIGLPHLLPGFYLIQFEQGEVLETQKVLIL